MMRSNANASYRVFLVDPQTWENAAYLGEPTSVDVVRDSTADLVMSGSVTLDEAPRGYVRVMLSEHGESESEMVELATMLASTPRTTHGLGSSSEVECCSVLRPADAYELDLGWFFPKGGDPVAGALSLLKGLLAAPVDPVESDYRTSAHIYAESGETALSMARLLLSEASWHVTIDGHGTVSAKPDDMEPVATLDSRLRDIVTGDVTEEADLSGIPNVVRVTDGEGRWAEARNDDADSDTSTHAVGFEVRRFEEVSVGEGETLLGKAYEILDEESASARVIEYTRDYDPSIMEGDIIEVNLPEHGVNGRFRVRTQSFGTEGGPAVSETAEMVLDTFRR